MREGTGFRAVPNLQASPPWRSNFPCDVQSRPCKSQYKCVSQDCKHKHEAATLTSILQCRTRPSTLDRSWIRRTDNDPHIAARTLFIRENKGFRAIPNLQASPERSNCW